MIITINATRVSIIYNYISFYASFTLPYFDKDQSRVKFLHTSFMKSIAEKEKSKIYLTERRNKCSKRKQRQ